MNGLALFAGVGGLDLGINLAIPSSRTVCYVEREAYAASVLVSKMETGQLHPAPIWSDITTFDGKEWCGKVDYISAGFPCQPFSVSGKQKGIEDDRWLWDDIERIIGEVRPSFIFLENVPGVVIRGLPHILATLASMGFNAEWGNIRASEVGANHHRDRFFLFGYIPERFQILSNTFGFRVSQSREICKGTDGPIIECNGSKGGIIPDPDSFSNAMRRHDKNNEKSFQRGQGKSSRSEYNCGEGHNKIAWEAGYISDPPGIGFQELDISPVSERVGHSSRPFNEKWGSSEWWSVEPGMGRVVDGVAHRVDRIRACGNGVVPLQAAVAYTELIRRGGESQCLI